MFLNFNKKHTKIFFTSMTTTTTTTLGALGDPFPGPKKREVVTSW